MSSSDRTERDPASLGDEVCMIVRRRLYLLTPVVFVGRIWPFFTGKPRLLIDKYCEELANLARWTDYG